MVRRYVCSISSYPGEHWFFPVNIDMMKASVGGWGQPDNYPVDGRGLTYYWGFSSIKRAAGGKLNQIYLMSISDKDGNRLNGSNTYQLSVPAKVPVRQYWSLTAYDPSTHTLIRDVPWASRSSHWNLQINPDGATDVWLGPKAPQGKEANWIPTETGHEVELIFRFYGAEKAAADKTWVLPDP